MKKINKKIIFPILIGIVLACYLIPAILKKTNMPALEIKHGSADTSIVSMYKGHKIPIAISRRKKMPQVRDQGRFGTCSEFAIAYALGSKKDKAVFSPAFITAYMRYYSGLTYLSKVNKMMKGFGVYHFNHMPRNDLDIGVNSVSSGLEIARMHGICLEYQHSYKSENFEKLPKARIRKQAAKNGIYNYGGFYVGGFDSAVPGYLGINRARLLLARGKPVIMHIRINSNIYKFVKTGAIFSFAESGNLSSKPYKHALCLTGYNDTISTVDGKGVFYAINCWGASSLRDGYLIITYQEMAWHQYDNYFYWFSFSKKDYNEVFEILYE